MTGNLTGNGPTQPTTTPLYGTPPEPGTHPFGAPPGTPTGWNGEPEPPYAPPPAAVPAPAAQQPWSTSAPTSAPRSPAPSPRRFAPARPARPWPGPGHRSAVSAVRWTGIAVVALLLLGGTGSTLAGFFAQSETTVKPVPGPITRVVTDLGTGDVRVRAGAAGQPVQVRSTLHWTFRKPVAVINPENGVLTLRSECPGTAAFTRCSVDFEVTVPADTSLELQSNTGDINATGLTGAVTARTSTGDVTVTEVGTKPVDARSDTGDVTVRGNAQDTTVQARTSTGDVVVAVTGAPSAVTATSDTGDVTVRVPATATYRVDTHSDTGDHRVTGVSTDSASPRHITADTSTGDVTVAGD